MTQISCSADKQAQEAVAWNLCLIPALFMGFYGIKEFCTS